MKVLLPETAITCSNKHREINSGFTLVEIVVGVTIIGFITYMIANLPPSIRLIGDSRHQEIAKEVATAIIEDLRSKTYDNLANTDPNSPISYSDSRIVKLPDGSAYYSIAECPVTICKNTPKESTKIISATVKWKSYGQDKEIELETLISKGGLY